jgi:hypothetical protein
MAMDSTELVRKAKAVAAMTRSQLLLSAALVALIVAAPSGDRASAMNLSTVGGVHVGAVHVPPPHVTPAPAPVIHTHVFVPHNTINLTNAERVDAIKVDPCGRTNRERRTDRARCNPGPVVNNGGDQPPGEGTSRFPHRPIWHQPILPVTAPIVTTEPLPSGGGTQPPSGLTAQVQRRAGSGVPSIDEHNYRSNELVTELVNTATPQLMDALGRRFRLTRLQTVAFGLGGTTLVRWRINDRRTVPTVVRAWETDNTPMVKSALLSVQPNYLFVMQDDAAPTPPPSEGDPAQYILDKMHLPQAHELARGDRVLVAVIDSGVDVANPDLAGDIAGTFDAVGSGAGAFKPHSHGTAIAGAIAAHGRLMGAAPAAQILAVRAFSGETADEGTTFAIMSGLSWAVGHGARVINMSFAGPQDPGIARSLAAAHDRGVVLVAAAGNKGAKSPPLYPAADPSVIAVTSTDAADQLPVFANRGRYVAVAAPGVDLMLLGLNGTLQFSSGTSFSAAYVSGTAALMLERKPDLGPDALRQALTGTAHHLGPVAAKPADEQSGAGLVDAYRAVLSLAPPAAPAAADAGVTVTPASVRR